MSRLARTGHLVGVSLFRRRIVLVKYIVPGLCKGMGVTLSPAYGVPLTLMETGIEKSCNPERETDSRSPC
jgi:hypothetical protein